MTSIDHILALQETDIRIRELEKMKADIPERQEREKNRLGLHKEALKKAEESLKQKQIASKSLEGEVQARKEKILKLRTQQMEIKTNKEFRAIEDEISLINAQISALEDRELVLMQEIEDSKKEVASLTEKLNEESKAVQSDVEKWNSKLLEIEDNLKLLREKRKEQASKVENGWLAAYEAIFSRKDKAIVPVIDGVCSGCHMNVPRYVVHNSKKHSEMVKCSYCGRLLY